MRKKGFTLVEVMIVVAIIALLAAIAIPNVLRARINANEAAVQARLRTISTAAESYAAANDGFYPANMTNLTNATPKYLNKALDITEQGYNVTCSFSSTSYTCNATPQNINTTGTKSFAVCTGGILNSTTGSSAPSCG